VSGRRDAALAACARQDGAELSYPFGEGTAVYKVGKKIFAISGLEHSPGQITLKCDPSTVRRCAPSTPPSRPGTT
jgi:predicted DNA-binding protein (MmcQ/YjbR family)